MIARNVYHGILVDASFTDTSFPETFKSFARTTAGSWRLYGIEVPSAELDAEVARIQDAMKSDQPYDAHLYNDRELVGVFKNRVFRVAPHCSTWEPILEFGRALDIPEEQLDFWPK
jgi:hypothetical protein